MSCEEKSTKDKTKGAIILAIELMVLLKRKQRRRNKESFVSIHDQLRSSPSGSSGKSRLICIASFKGLGKGQTTPPRHGQT